MIERIEQLEGATAQASPVQRRAIFEGQHDNQQETIDDRVHIAACPDYDDNHDVAHLRRNRFILIVSTRIEKAKWYYSKTEGTVGLKSRITFDVSSHCPYVTPNVKQENCEIEICIE